MAKLTISQMKANLTDIRIWRRVIISWIYIAIIVGGLFSGAPIIAAVPIIAVYFVSQFWRARHLLFSFSGRVGRKAFWLIVVAFAIADFPLICVIVAAVQGIFHEAKPTTFAEKLWLAAALVPFVIVPTAVGVVGLGVRRLHDLGKSYAWLLALYGIPVVGIGLFNLPMISQAARGIVLLVIILPSLLCAFVVLGLSRGVVGPNEFGADPNSRSATLDNADARSDHPPQAVRPV
jgi:uncharacterized membrane protein YhaH (DUF805 family)